MWIAAGATLAVLAIVAVSVVLLGGSSDETAEPVGPTGPPPVKPQALMDLADAAAIEGLEPFERAATLAQINEASGAAERSGQEIDALLEDLPRITSPAARTATETALKSTRAILTSFAALKGFDGGNDVQWVMVSTAAEDEADAREDATDRLVELGAYEAEEDVLEQLDSTIDQVDARLGAIAAQLSTWRTQVKQIEADKAQRLAALDAYAESVRPLLDRYSGLRRDAQDFVDRVDTVGATYDEAYSFFESAASQRQSIRTSLATLTPPAKMAASHSGLLAVIDTAIGAVNDAAAGVRQDEFSYFTYYKDTPGWQTFESKSDQITGAYDSAVGVWNDAVDAERAEIEAIPLPPKPTV